MPKFLDKLVLTTIQLSTTRRNSTLVFNQAFFSWKLVFGSLDKYYQFHQQSEVLTGELSDPITWPGYESSNSIMQCFVILQEFLCILEDLHIGWNTLQLVQSLDECSGITWAWQDFSMDMELLTPFSKV